MPLELGELIEEEDTVVGQRHLTRHGHLTAANQPHIGNGMVREAKWPGGDDGGAPPSEAGDRVDARCVDGCHAPATAEDDSRAMPSHDPQASSRAYAGSGEQVMPHAAVHLIPPEPPNNLRRPSPAHIISMFYAGSAPEMPLAARPRRACRVCRDEPSQPPGLASRPEPLSFFCSRP